MDRAKISEVFRCGFNSHRAQILNKKLKETATKLNLPIQEEVWPSRTCTDGDTIIKTNDGTPIVLFSIPLRYMHSPVEVASYIDVESMIEIISELIVDLDENLDLKLV